MARAISKTLLAFVLVAGGLVGCASPSFESSGAEARAHSEKVAQVLDRADNTAARRAVSNVR